jgi:hypothetical protein
MPRDGGAAFPFTHASGYGESTVSEGMSLREWFAGQAMAALLVGTPTEGDSTAFRKAVAISAYQMADEMLKARK